MKINFNIAKNTNYNKINNNSEIKTNASLSSINFKSFIQHDLFEKEPDKNIFKMDNDEFKHYIQKFQKDPELLEKFLLQKDGAGNTVLIQSKKEQAELIINAVKDKPKLLEKMIMQTNYKGFVPAQLVEDETLQVILTTIKDNPKLLEKFLTTKDFEGDTILSYGNSFNRLLMILNVLKNRYDLLEKVLLSKNKDGDIPVQSTIPTVTIFILKNIEDNLYLLKKIIESQNNDGETLLDKIENQSEELYYRMENEPELKNKLTIAKNTDSNKLFKQSLGYMIDIDYSEDEEITDNNITNTLTYKIKLPHITLI